MASSGQVARTLLAATSAGIASSAGIQGKVTPMEKVIQLLNNLKTEVETEGTTEAATYDTFACFCKTKTTSFSTSILNGKDSINGYSADIELKTSAKGQAEEDLAAEKQKEEQLNKDLEATNQDCASGLAAYQASDADLSKAISSLNGAIQTMENSKPGLAPSAANLLSVRQTVKSSMMLADALKLVENGPHWGQALVLLEEGSGVNPSDPGFKFHSQGIIKILNDLLNDFTGRKEDADAKEATRAQACIDKVAEINNQLSLAATAITGYKEQIGTLTMGIATARNSLVESEALLKDDQALLKDLTDQCEARAKDYDQRSSMRSQELTALTSALQVLGNAPDEAKRASFGQVTKRAPLSFFQSRVVSAHRQQDAVASAGQARALRKSHALDFLRTAGTKLRSTALLTMAARAEAGPFDKIKGLIEKLIQRLVKEATEEATKKGYCDTATSKANTDRDFRYQDVLTLNTEIEGLESKRDALELEITDLTNAVSQLNTDLETATTNRNSEKADNLATISKDKEGAVALQEALMIINSFYKEAAKASFVQTTKQQPPVAEGSYQGKQDAIKGIVGLLDVIKSDFMREMQETQEAEKAAAAEFVLYERDAKADIAAKTTKKELDQEDLATTTSTIDTKMNEMKKNMELLDAALGQLEALKPMCADSGMSYAERVAKREQEIAHLKTALCILDEQQVEEECQGAAPAM